MSQSAPPRLHYSLLARHNDDKSLISSISHLFFPTDSLFWELSLNPMILPRDDMSTPESGTDAGASGSSTTSSSISTGGLIAIVVIVVAVAILGSEY